MTQEPQSDPHAEQGQNDMVGNGRENKSTPNGRKQKKQFSCPVSSNYQRKTLDRRGKLEPNKKRVHFENELKQHDKQ